MGEVELSTLTVPGRRYQREKTKTRRDCLNQTNKYTNDNKSKIPEGMEGNRIKTGRASASTRKERAQKEMCLSHQNTSKGKEGKLRKFRTSGVTDIVVVGFLLFSNNQDNLMRNKLSIKPGTMKAPAHRKHSINICWKK